MYTLYGNIFIIMEPSMKSSIINCNHNLTDVCIYNILTMIQ